MREISYMLVTSRRHSLFGVSRIRADLTQLGNLTRATGILCRTQ